MADKRLDQATGIETVGHEWDGIEELNTPLPRWWLYTFYATIVFAIGYVVVYPAVPLAHSGTPGLWKWSSRGALAAETAGAEQARAKTLAAIAALPIEELPGKPELMQAAIAGGKAAFRVNCVQCHGSGAAGSKGYPNLNDDDWLWGGDLKATTAFCLRARSRTWPAMSARFRAGWRRAVLRRCAGPGSSRPTARSATGRTARVAARSARRTWPTRSGSMAATRPTWSPASPMPMPGSCRPGASGWTP